jgi:hypothetical protein
MCWCRAHSETCDQRLLPVERLLSESCSLVSVGCPIWREDGSTICSAITQWSELCRTYNHTLLSHLRFLQPGRPGSRIYIPQEHGGLLWLVRLRWKYSNHPPSQVKLYYNRRSVGLSISVLGTHFGPTTNCFLLSLIIFRLMDLVVWGALSDENSQIQSHFTADSMSVSSPLCGRLTRYWVVLSWCYDRRSVGLYILVSGTPLGPMTRFFSFVSFVEQLLCSSF